MSIFSRVLTVVLAAMTPAAEADDAELSAPRAAVFTLETDAADAIAEPGPLAQAPKLSVDDVVNKLQRTYEGTTDFSASFTQRFTYTVLRRTQESKGTVMFKRPGLMRWDYATPSKKTFAVSEGQLTIWQIDDHTVMRDHCFKQDGLTASVQFLWGAGKISEQFDVSWFPGQFGKKTDHHLLLTPKQKNSIFVKLILVVDPKTYLVQQSVVVDPQGNVNQFMYADLKLNRGLSKTAFNLTIPEAVPISRLPGSCDPKRAKTR